MEKQQTVAKSASLSGIALHTGARVTLKITPGEVDTGILFRRVDMPNRPSVRALASNVIDVRRGTTIADRTNGAVVVTVEHIMATLHAYGIDNAVVEMDGAEPPIADGSALPFCELIESAGVAEQDAEAKYFTPSRPVFIDGGVTKLAIAPADKLEISCVTSFAGCPVDPQFFATDVTAELFKKELAGGRTFVQYGDLKQLIAMGLAKGGSLDAAAIIHDGAIICKEALRYPNEIVRHKIMDLVGDIYLCGRRVRGTIIAVKPGHPRNVELAGKLQQMMLEENL